MYLVNQSNKIKNYGPADTKYAPYIVLTKWKKYIMGAFYYRNNIFFYKDGTGKTTKERKIKFQATARLIQA